MEQRLKFDRMISMIIPRSWEWYKMVYPSIPEQELKKLYEEQTGNNVDMVDRMTASMIIPRSWKWYKMVYPSIPEQELKKLYEEQTGNKV